MSNNISYKRQHLFNEIDDPDDDQYDETKLFTTINIKPDDGTLDRKIDHVQKISNYSDAYLFRTMDDPFNDSYDNNKLFFMLNKKIKVGSKNKIKRLRQTNCDDCTVLGQHSCLQCPNCGLCLNENDEGFCLPGTKLGPTKTDKVMYDTFGDYCYKWSYDRNLPKSTVNTNKFQILNIVNKL